MTSYVPHSDTDNHLRFVFDDAVVLLPFRGRMTFAEVAQMCEAATDSRHRRVRAIDITLPLAAARPADRGNPADQGALGQSSAAVVAISRLAGAATGVGSALSA